MPIGAEGLSPRSTSDRFPVKTWLIAFAGWMFDFYDLVLFSFLLVPIGRDFHLSNAEETWLLGVALGASGIGGIVFGYFSDVFGRKRVMMWTVCLYSLGTGLTALATGPWTLVMFRLLTGLGVGGEWAVGHALMAESTPTRMRGRGSAMLQAGEPVGVGLAAIVGLVVAPVIGWRAVFLLSSASAGIAIVVRRHLPESPLWHEEHLSPREAIAELSRQGLLFTLLRSWILGTFKLGTYWTCYTWLPKFMQTEFHLPGAQSAVWILTAQLGQFLGMMTFGFFADRVGRRLSFTVYSLVTACALYALAFHWQTLLPHAALFWAVMFTLGLGSGCTAGFGALLAELFPTDVRNFAMGTAYNMARGVQFFAPKVVSMFVIAYGLRGGLSVPLVLAIATASWVWTLPETRGRDLSKIGVASGPRA